MNRLTKEQLIDIILIFLNTSKQLLKEKEELKQQQNKTAIGKLEELYNCFNEINNVPFDCEPSIIINREFALSKINSMIQELKGGSDE